jgi:hypothetical protein
LSEALVPLLRDLENSGTVLPDIFDEQERDFDGQLSARGGLNAVEMVIASPR